jgi:hypothetical protein
VFENLGMNDFSMVDKDDLEWKRNYGTAVHRGIELMIFDRLDWDSVDEHVVAPITGVESFLKQLEYEPVAAEERKIVTLNGMKYGATLDHRGLITWHGKRRKLVADIKTGSKYSPTWAWQGGGYLPDLTHLFLVIQVSKEGKVTPHWIDAVKAQREFCILLAASNLKTNAGLGGR